MLARGRLVFALFIVAGTFILIDWFERRSGVTVRPQQITHLPTASGSANQSKRSNAIEVAKANTLLPRLSISLLLSTISIVSNATGTILVMPLATGFQIGWSVTSFLAHVVQFTAMNSSIDVMTLGSTDANAMGVVMSGSTLVESSLAGLACSAAMVYNGWNTSGVLPSANSSYPLPVFSGAFIGGALRVVAITTTGIGYVATAVGVNVSSSTSVNCTQPMRLNSSVTVSGGHSETCIAIYNSDRVVSGAVGTNATTQVLPLVSSFSDVMCAVTANFSLPGPSSTMKPSTSSPTTTGGATLPTGASSSSSAGLPTSPSPTNTRAPTRMTTAIPIASAIVPTTAADSTFAPLFPLPVPVPQSAPPPFMANATLSSINSPLVHRIAIYLSLILLYEPAATALARLESFDVLAACPTLVRSSDVSPFALGIGGGRDEFLRGTVTASLLLILFVTVILLLVMIWVSSLCAKKVERPFTTVFLELCNILHFPSCTLCVTVAAVAQPAVMASVVLFGDGDKDSDFVFGMITFLYMFAYALATGLLLSFLFRCHLRPVVKWAGVAELAPILGDAAILAKPLDVWMQPNPLNWQHPFERGWKQRYFSFFGIYRLPAYILIDFVFTCIIGIVLGSSTERGSETMCYVQSSIVTAFALVLAILAAMGWSVMPMLPRLYIVVVNGTMIASGLSTLVALSQNDPAAQNVSQAFKVGGVVITYIILLARFVFCVSHLPRTIHRVRFWMDKRGHVTQLNFVPAGDLEAENLAALLPDAREEEEREMQVTALIEAAQENRGEQAAKEAKAKEQLESFLAEL